MSPLSFRHSFVLLCIVLSMTLSTLPAMSGVQDAPQPIAPANGAVLRNNMPQLTWTTVACDLYEIWIDGHLMGTVPHPQNGYVAFALSFGKHEWRVVAVKDGKNVSGKSRWFVVDDTPMERLPQNALLLRHDWQVQSSVLAGDDGARISGKYVANDWYRTSVPATVLTVLVRNGVYPNPMVGQNNRLIPDSNDAFNTKNNLLQFSHIPGVNPWKHPYWYRTVFEVPKSYEGKMVWLNFGEINYRAEVWLNGSRVADTSVMVGMERQFRFRVDKLLNHKGKNYLAIAIYPPDYPGEPAPEPLEALADPGTNMGDGVISRNYTKWDALGWDWQPPVRDRDMGITEDVYLSATDALEATHLYVTSRLPLPDTSYADITVSASLINHKSQADKGTLFLRIRDEKGTTTITRPYSVGAGDTLEFLLNREQEPALRLHQPSLWWPAGYGRPYLYDISLEAVSDAGYSSSVQTHMGIRSVETFIGPQERRFKINGKEVFLKGGNWVIDMMLNWTTQRYQQEIELTRNANMNLLRVWGPTGVPPSAFFDAADKLGILIWQDFLNDYWGTWRNRAGFRPEERLFAQATTDVILKLRNHPSLFLWCGGNEGVNPREALITQHLLPAHDGRGDRYYLKQSDGDGLHGGGPYHTLEPAAYFGNKKLTGFSSEVGATGVPVLESILKFAPGTGTAWKAGFYPLNKDWGYHDAFDWTNDVRKFSSYDKILRRYYGAPDSTSAQGVKDYLEKAQWLNSEIYLAATEAIGFGMGEGAGGFCLWKTNSSWPSILWQIYDWYLQPHAGYYAVQKTGEPIHIQWNRQTMSVDVSNKTHKPVPAAILNARLYNESSQVIWSRDTTMTLEAFDVTHTGWTVPGVNELCFLVLTTKNQKGDVLSNQRYWIHSENDFSGLSTLPQTTLSGSVSTSVSGERITYRVTLTNSGKHPTFMTVMKLKGKVSGRELLPTLWNNNYMHLMPGETVVVQAQIDRKDVLETPVIECKASNTYQALILDAQAQDNRITFLNQKIFLNGTNVAWVSFGNDLGVKKRSSISDFEKIFAEVAKNGGNSVRIWLHTTGANTPAFNSDNSAVTGPGEGTIEDMEAMCDAAAKHKVGLVLCLWSFDMLRIKNGEVVTGRAKNLLVNREATMSYVNNALIPMVKRLKGHPGILCWEIFNEPEGMSDEFGWDFNYHVPMAAIQRFINLCTGAIHRTDKAALVTNGSWSFFAATDVGEGNKNYYTDKRLIEAGGDKKGTLDFYTVHYYDWAKEIRSPFHYDASFWKLDKPLVVGEFHPKTTFGVPAQDLHEELYKRGYAGAQSWSWTDSNHDIMLLNMKRVSDNHPKDILIK